MKTVLATAAKGLTGVAAISGSTDIANQIPQIIDGVNSITELLLKIVVSAVTIWHIIKRPNKQ